MPSAGAFSHWYKLTDREQQMLFFIWDYRRAKGRYPTLSDIGRAIGITHSGVRHILVGMEYKRVFRMVRMKGRVTIQEWNDPIIPPVDKEETIPEVVDIPVSGDETMRVLKDEKVSALSPEDRVSVEDL
jgi:hypothetical protein